MCVPVQRMCNGERDIWARVGVLCWVKGKLGGGGTPRAHVRGGIETLMRVCRK